MLKILQARLQQYMNCEISDIQAGFRKDRGTRDQIANVRCIIENTRENRTRLHQMFKLDLEKAKEPEIKLPTSTGSSKK